ncbi:conserved exported hypothetical protein [Candidatus Accumulibacter aalborgensis]|uniref:Uncharacterized protein n=1 Tax=Candidatus Accumulibacter aalborgensis TaxID=1860102 RepID=A0A1A8XU33_9PROT|nr:hypothetical protein [Candidatus Accumulibacter aalborgensis]SBT08575.1 conserved exported hypothetical protein [Candidatus Accumulibacter aalborgensis]
MHRTLISSLAMTAALMFFGNAAFAHDDAALDKISGPNGGQLRMAGPYHFELVVAKNSKEAKDNPVTVYLTDHGDKKIPAAGATGTATILAAKSKITVPLAPSGDNKLTGVGSYASDPQMKVVVSVTFASAKAEQARFTPLLSAAADGHTDHQH